jgi:hypothetical protein
MNAEVPEREVTLLDVLDSVLDRGVVLAGELTISVAGVDLIFVGLQLVVATSERVRERSLGSGANA